MNRNKTIQQNMSRKKFTFGWCVISMLFGAAATLPVYNRLLERKNAQLDKAKEEVEHLVQQYNKCMNDNRDLTEQIRWVYIPDPSTNLYNKTMKVNSGLQKSLQYMTDMYIETELRANALEQMYLNEIAEKQSFLEYLEQGNQY